MECERERKRELGKSGREGEGRRRREGKKLFPENPSERAYQKHRAVIIFNWRTQLSSIKLDHLARGCHARIPVKHPVGEPAPPLFRVHDGFLSFVRNYNITGVVYNDYTEGCSHLNEGFIEKMHHKMFTETSFHGIIGRENIGSEK